MFIYVIVCSETLKIYVGQHKGRNLGWYLSRKFWDANHHTSGSRSRIYASMRKHPRASWSIYPLISDLQTREECDYWERRLIVALNAQHPEVGYNIAAGGDGGVGRGFGWHHSDESKAKSRLALLGRKLGLRGPRPEEVKQKIRAAHLGKKRGPMSEAQKIKISIANKGKQNTLGHRMTEEHKAKIQKALQGRIFTPEWREKISKAKMGNLGARVRWDREKGKIC